MGKHMHLHNQKRVVENDEFAQHLQDLSKRIHVLDLRKMIRNS